ncbi:MAG: DMT family transporter, partial [Parasporobacterium sp.]|nr:DMT family transporter [Parasporobacterium sp.]
HFAPLVDNVRLASIQFLVCGVLTLIPMVIFDWKCSVAGFLSWLPSLGTWDAWIALLYAGILSSGVAYTLQIIGQNNFNPTIASIIMSMESVFAALAGLVLLNQTLSTKEVIGCAVIFAAIIIAQLPLSKADRTQVHL